MFGPAQTIGDAIAETHPTSIRFLDLLGDGNDGEDAISAAVALISTARANAAPALFSFVSTDASRRAIGFRGNAHGRRRTAGG